MEPRYVIPTRRYITDTAVPKLYEEVKQEVAESLSKAERVALTCDAWTSRATESYVTITSHYISDQWKLVSHVLQTRVMYKSHSGSNIADLLENAVEEWSITEKDPAIVTDNASNMAIAARLASFVHIKCFAHTLNLASQRALKLPTVSRLLGRVRRITNFFRRSVLGCHVLQQKLLQLPEHKLKTDVVTRWNSAFEMVERFLEQQPAITAALLSPEVRKNEKDLCTLSESDISNAEEVIRALKPMQVATSVMCEESNPTLSVIAPLHAQLLHNSHDNLGDSQIVKDIKESVKIYRRDTCL